MRSAEKDPSRVKFIRSPKSGRYQHRPEWVEDMAEKNGFVVLWSSRQALRFEAKKPVMGGVFVLEMV